MLSMNFQFYLIRRSIICQGGRKNRTGESLRCGLVQVSVSSSACQTLTQASDGMRQSPLGESVTEPTFGPSLELLLEEAAVEVSEPVQEHFIGVPV